MKPLCVVSCPIDTFSGYGARSRDFVKALIKLKDDEWDIKIAPQRWGDCPWGFISKNDPIKQRFLIGPTNNRPDIWIQITVPNEFQPYGTSYNIGVTAGIETNVCPPSFIEGMNRMDLNLISSKHSKDVAAFSTFEKRNKQTNAQEGVIKLQKPCEVLFEGLDLDTYFKNPEKSEILNDIKEDFCFLFTGHWLQGKIGEDRKNVGLMIKTFLETFSGPGSKKPALVLKMHHVNYSILDQESTLERINKLRKKYGNANSPNIYLLHGELTDKEMNKLNNDSKIKSFISFTKGEGFGRPLLEASITGKPVITTNWSGHKDFLNPKHSVLIGGELKPVHSSAVNDFLIKESQWFNIDTNTASKAIKDIFKHYKKYIKGSRKQTQYIKDNFSFDKMVEALNGYLPKLTPKPNVDVPLNLPKLKKAGTKPPSLKLPKLKKIEI